MDQWRFFCFRAKALEDISGDQSVWEREPLEKLSNSLEIAAYKHNGFWQPMDTLRDLQLLNDLWNSNSAPWKIW